MRWCEAGGDRMTNDDSRSTLIRASAADGDAALDPTSGPDSLPGFESDSDVDELEPPYVLLRSGDGVDRTVSVSIARPDGVVTSGEYRLVDDHARLLAIGAPLGGVLRIEVDAGTGGTARVSVDPSRVGATPVPEFVVRGDRISVSGLAASSERAADSGGERGIS